MLAENAKVLKPYSNFFFATYVLIIFQPGPKLVSRRMVIDWVLTSSKALPKNTMASTFTECAYTIPDNGNGGEKISCLTRGDLRCLKNK